jgi:hypothetical protein
VRSDGAGNVFCLKIRFIQVHTVHTLASINYKHGKSNFNKNQQILDFGGQALNKG